ncbi:MAG TPA: hypothetical protein VHX68_09330 [Planctomycetaceae bacterium]|jgi:hypothetical protein|nr:hypothetical protein [Planctomycetaceae bacterium]
MPVAAAENHTNGTYDAFGDPVPSTPAKAPMAPAPVEAADTHPTCAAPAANVVAPAKTVVASQTAPANPSGTKPVQSPAWTPTRAPASAESVTPTEAVTMAPENAQVVIPAAKAAAIPKAASAVTEKAAVASVQKVSVAKAADTAHSMAKSPQPVVHADAASGTSMICDSKTVRGRFTGISHAAVKAPSQVEPLFNEPAPASAPAAPAPHAAPAPPEEATSRAPEQPAPIPSADAVKPTPHVVPDAKAADQTSRAPAKRASAVVNAVAQQVGPSATLDPFALEQTVDNKIDETTSPAPSHAPPKADGLPPLHAGDEPPFERSPSQVVAASPDDQTAAPDPPHETAGVATETWFAMGLGIGVGLAAGLVLWMRLRAKSATPSSSDDVESLKAAA